MANYNDDILIDNAAGASQECRDELMALITGLRGGVGP